MARVEQYAIPTFLYRYRSLKTDLKSDGLTRRNRLEEELASIKETFIYCAKYRDMNDPMEGRYLSTTKARDQPTWKETVEALKNEKSNLGIASFSETWDHELMWAHYADGFHGICICYNFSRLTKSFTKRHALSRISYSERPYTLNVARSGDPDIRARHVLSQKSVRWAYEREWRLFSPNVGEARYTLPIIEHVYLGVRMNGSIRTDLEKQLTSLGIEVRPTTLKGYAVIREDEEKSLGKPSSRPKKTKKPKEKK